MLIRSFFFIIMSLSPFLISAEISPIKDPKQIVPLQAQHLETLIEMTQATLNNLQILSKQLKDYQEVQERYLADTKDNEMLYRMVKSAQKLLENIKSANLVHSFDPDFISELNLLSQIAQKIGIPKL